MFFVYLIKIQTSLIKKLKFKVFQEYEDTFLIHLKTL